MDAIIFIIGIALFLRWMVIISGHSEKATTKLVTGIQSGSGAGLRNSAVYKEFVKMNNSKPVMDKLQDVGPSVLITKEFIVPKRSGYTLPKIDKPTEWFIGEWGIGQPSPAEQKIIDELVKYNIHWEREVSFRGLILPSGGYARYDFYLPKYEIIIEYNGKLWHSDPEKQKTDLIKSEFCQANNLQLITWTSKHYHNIPESVEYLMRGLRIARIDRKPY